MPPPAPTTLRMSEVKNSVSSRTLPRSTTVQIKETRGVTAMPNAQTTSSVTTRSLARRAPSTRRAHA